MSLALGYGFKRRSYMFYHQSRHIFGSQWIGGAILLFFVIVALVLANLPSTADIYHAILDAPIWIKIGTFDFRIDIERFVNDGLMMIFFFSVGLEIKREVVSGHLSSVQKAILPVAGALGGMLMPAAIYLLFNHGTEYAAGWGIPMATDIAFAIAILSVIGRNVPTSLKVFLTALAVADDLGSIVVIAVFYGSSINLWMLVMAAAVLMIAWALNTLKVNSFTPYILISVVLWFLFYHSGIHATIAGVLLAMFIPSTPKYNKKYFLYKIRYYMNDFINKDKGIPITENADQVADLYRIRVIATESSSLSQRFEHLLSPWVNFVIMPLFALANAGVEITDPSDLNIFASTQTLGIFFGLWIGKPLGITLMSWLFIKTKLSVMPAGASWASLIAIACLGGIGFTMSIFIDTLAFASQPHLIASGKIAILAASVIAAISGFIAVKCESKHAPNHTAVTAE